VLGGTPPASFTYELFNDEHGQKISKSKGNGLTIEEWLRYAPPESLAYFMYQSPQRAKRLFFDVIPRALEDLLQVLRALPEDSDAEAIQNQLYEVGKRHPFANLRDWFACLYQVLLGAQEGPRFGGFVALYGIPGTIGLIETALAREASPEAPAA
jgi:lysyl-tRNA synthetase class I